MSDYGSDASDARRGRYELDRTWELRAIVRYRAPGSPFSPVLTRVHRRIVEESPLATLDAATQTWTPDACRTRLTQAGLGDADRGVFGDTDYAAGRQALVNIFADGLRVDPGGPYPVAPCSDDHRHGTVDVGTTWRLTLGKPDASYFATAETNNRLTRSYDRALTHPFARIGDVYAHSGKATDHTVVAFQYFPEYQLSQQTKLLEQLSCAPAGGRCTDRW